MELRNIRGKHNEAKWRKLNTDILSNSNFQLRSSTHACVYLQQMEMVQSLGLPGSVLRERTGVECHEATLRGLMLHSTGRTGKTLVPPEK